ncbi:hypothetical protein SAMN05444503_105150 [Pseudomonas sp. BS3767]|uniref:Uncharacterized protein n=1 Tax=Pseudomonas syringae TaxID=317 RepID=A0AB37ZQ30_PSESX|nr:MULTISPECIES: hypothetical protein [Pseudomonas]SDH68684.1 hypothetical protein SAMN05444503_105150 [Pseudomonas sp. BS3767]SDN38971.1 hypothetical protein SAMN05444502_105150 [Pseudomonas sp. BS3759]SDN46282.1 hypothetical protein SAMN05444505_108150 [Pseudomonas syringae]
MANAGFFLHIQKTRLTFGALDDDRVQRIEIHAMKWQRRLSQG